MSTQIFDRPEPERRVGCLERGCITAVVVVVVLMAVWHIIIGGSPLAYTPPIRGQVIDERTGKPLGGVVIVARWYTEGSLGKMYLMYASEGITKADGSFVHPGMPLRIRGLFEQFTILDPELYLYKPGYATSRLTNAAIRRFGYASQDDWTLNPKQACYWDGKTIPLHPVDSVQGEAEALNSIYYDVVKASEVLHPRRFPLVWSVMIQGSRRVPKSYLHGQSSPKESYEYYMRTEQ